MTNELPLCIIPARGGSKRIPRKNIKHFLGKPMIQYSIEAALESKLFCKVMVSTDDQEIASIAKDLGAEVPFFRSVENSNDMAMTAEVLIEVLDDYAKTGEYFKNVCCLYPTAPFISSHRLIDSYTQFSNSAYDALVPVVKFSYPIQRSLKFTGDKVEMFWPQNYSKRSQDLEPAFHDAGQFYWIKEKPLRNEIKLFLKNTFGYILSDLEVQDIDNQEDWEIAEWKMKWLLQQKK